jgi:hypothetical protein
MSEILDSDGGTAEGRMMDADDAYIARIMAMTPEELRAHIIADGGDPDEYAREAREIFEKVKAGLRPGRG